MSTYKAEMLNKLVAFIHSRGGVGVTRKEIADYMGLKQSPYLWELIKQVIDAGWATEPVRDDSLPRSPFRYYPSRPKNVRSDYPLTAEDIGP